MSFSYNKETYDICVEILREIKVPREKLIKEFLADLRGELRIYDIIKKWEKRSK